MIQGPGTRDEEDDEIDSGAADPIGSLIRTAGRRPSPAGDAVDRVRAQVHARWQSEVARRRRRRSLAWGVSAAAAAVLLLVGARVWLRPAPSVPGAPAVLAHVDLVAGAAWRSSAPERRAEPATALRAGDPIAAGEEIMTEPGSRLALRAASGHSLRLDGRTRVRIVSSARLDLIEGALYLDSGPSGAAGRLDVGTPFGVIQEIGTQFEVRLPGSGVRVRVREGSVRIKAAGGSYPVEAGGQAELDPHGTLRRESLPAWGEAWAWMEGAAPSFDVKGRTLREFLDYVARERGLRLGFSGPRAAEEASRIVLSGSIAGLTLDQALETVLPTCRMSHRIQGGLLVLEPQRPEDNAS